MDTLSILKIIKGIFAILDLFVWARVILSWVPHNQYNEITRTVYNVTEPLLRPLRDLSQHHQWVLTFPLLYYFLP